MYTFWVQDINPISGFAIIANKHGLFTNIRIGSYIANIFDTSVKGIICKDYSKGILMG